MPLWLGTFAAARSGAARQRSLDQKSRRLKSDRWTPRVQRIESAAGAGELAANP
jgi:hypothetical protein